MLDYPMHGVAHCRNHPDRNAVFRVRVAQRNGVKRRIGFYCNPCGERYRAFGIKRGWPHA